MKNTIQKLLLGLLCASLIGGFIALLLFRPVFLRNDFMRYVEAGQYQKAGDFFRTNFESGHLDEACAPALDVLDGQIQAMWVALYDQTADFDDAELLGTLYCDIAQGCQLPGENGQALLSSLGMYRELAELNGYLRDEDYETLAVKLLDSRHKTVEPFVELLGRSITDENKSLVVAGFDEALERHLNSATSSKSFAQKPYLLDGESPLQSFLLTKSQCKKLNSKLDQYNRQSACSTRGCKNWAGEKNYCSEHKCDYEYCDKPRRSGSNECGSDCAYPGCSNHRHDVGLSYCTSHICNAKGCNRYSTVGNYCSAHASRNYCDYCDGKGKRVVTWYSEGDWGEVSYTSYTCKYCNGTGRA